MSRAHEQLARRYPTRELDGTAPSGTSWTAGDTYDPAILGWVLGVIVEPADGSELIGSLQLRLPMKSTAAHRVVGFRVTRGGQTFVPWPFADLTLQDVSGGVNVSTATVSFWPVFRSDPFPSGIGSVLYGRQKQADPTPAGFLDFAVPEGATEYRIMPATATGALTIEEQGSGPVVQTYGRYVMAAAATAVPIGTETGWGSWRVTPPDVGANIRVTGTAAADEVTAFWRFDLGALR